MARSLSPLISQSTCSIPTIHLLLPAFPLPYHCSHHKVPSPACGATTCLHCCALCSLGLWSQLELQLWPNHSEPVWTQNQKSKREWERKTQAQEWASRRAGGQEPRCKAPKPWGWAKSRSPEVSLFIHTLFCLQQCFLLCMTSCAMDLACLCKVPGQQQQTIATSSRFSPTYWQLWPSTNFWERFRSYSISLLGALFSLCVSLSNLGCLGCPLGFLWVVLCSHLTLYFPQNQPLLPGLGEAL